MFQEFTKFYTQLELNNNKEWFHAHKAEYDKLNLEFQDFVQNCIYQIANFDPLLKFLTAKECTFRINRDVRFSNNKLPYKTNSSAVFAPGGKKNNSEPAYYFEFNSKGKITIGGGLYMPETSQLLKVRESISEKPKQLKKILNDKLFQSYFPELSGDMVKTIPRGFSKDNPNIELIRYKSYVVFYQDTINNYTDSELNAKIVKIFRAMYPLISYLRSIS